MNGHIMNKVALITDTHLGARGGNKVIRSHQLDFYANQFFPELKSRGINTIIHTGDFFDSRSSLTHQVIADALWFVRQLESHKISMKIIVGNHDTPNKNNNDLDATSMLLRSEYVTAIDSFVSDSNILFCPWVTKENQDAFMSAVTTTKARYCFGHFDILGAKFSKYGNPSIDGIEPKLFKKFDRVISGHFHTKSTIANIDYLGAPFEYTWVDWNDQKGYHVFDLDANELEFVQNKESLFFKLSITDSGTTCIPKKPTSFVDKFVRVESTIKDQKSLKKVSDVLGAVADLQITIMEPESIVESIRVGSIDTMIEDGVQSVNHTRRDGVLSILKSAMEKL
jgi:DNA repair exonuclease SbcCD nuclease subunit